MKSMFLSEGTSDVVDALVECSIPIQIVRYSLVTPMIKDEIEYEIVATSVVTSS